MLPAGFIQRVDRRGLRRLLVMFFLLLVVPTGVLIWQAYGQLKWESFYQYRVIAESLTGRIDSTLAEGMHAADSRTFADYAFLVISGEPSANFVQQSPLSFYPPIQDVPGTIGYFQVESSGTFSTPLLPAAGSGAAQYGITDADWQSRLLLAGEIQAILARNRLIRSRADLRQRAELRRRAESAAGEQSAMSFAAATEEQESPAELADQESRLAPAKRYADGADEPAAYDQDAFDKLSSNLPSVTVTGTRPETDSAKKLDDLGLDERYEQKNQAQRPPGSAAEAALGGRRNEEARSLLRRKEQTVLPQAASPEPAAGPPGTSGITLISTFESEVDPFEVSLLDDGHLVAYRNVWRDSERVVQGILIDSAEFFSAGVRAAYEASTISGMAALGIAYQGRLLSSDAAASSADYIGRGELSGSLLYRNRLSAPFDGIELVFSVDHLPPGPGARVLGWLTVILALVFVGGFVLLYRLGVGQIMLARQQQDFVSAVSHELKTPLTSIRMYGEMLKEGWADEAKRQSYYEFIHDESERLSRLITNVLQVARITRNDTQFDIKPVEAGKLMDHLESKLGTQIERAGFALEIERSADDAVLQVDEDSFMQIMINLVDNALKFSKSCERKVLVISCSRRDHEHVRFDVRDYGPGIAKSQLRKIFTMFYRPESELTRESVGTGIGLAIVQQLTQTMGGQVDVMNENPGVRFSIVFPAS